MSRSYRHWTVSMEIKTLYHRLEPRLTTVRRFLPGLAFIGGFTWDSLTMGQVVSFYDLLILTTYYLGAGLILILLVREVQPQWQHWFTYLIQFYFLGVTAASVFAVYQQYLIKDRKRELCFQAFLNNNWFGLVLFIGVFLDYQFAAIT